MKLLLYLLIATLPLVIAGCGLIKNKNNTNDTGAPSVTTSETNVVEKGDTIAVDYVGTLEDGTLFDTSIESEAKKGNKFTAGRTYEPLSFVA